MRLDWVVFAACGAFVWIYVWGCVLFSCWKWRERPGRAPARFHNNPPLEITYVILPVIMVTGLFAGLSSPVEQRVDSISADPVPIEVTAFRWSWQFTYPNSGVVITGTPESPPTLILPVDQTAQIDLRSADVTHSFWVPAFLFKRDAIPGMVNRFQLHPLRTGTYRGRCAQFCGLYHAFMTFTVRVVPAADFHRDLLTLAKGPT